MERRTKQTDTLTALQMLHNLDELESDGGRDIELEIDVADEESSSDSGVDFDPPPVIPEPRRRKAITETNKTMIPTATVRQESGRDGTVWVETSDELK